MLWEKDAQGPDSPTLIPVELKSAEEMLGKEFISEEEAQEG